MTNWYAPKITIKRKMTKQGKKNYLEKKEKLMKNPDSEYGLRHSFILESDRIARFYSENCDGEGNMIYPEESHNPLWESWHLTETVNNEMYKAMNMKLNFIDLLKRDAKRLGGDRKNKPHKKIREYHKHWNTFIIDYDTSWGLYGCPILWNNTLPFPPHFMLFRLGDARKTILELAKSKQFYPEYYQREYDNDIIIIKYSVGLLSSSFMDKWLNN